ncbi:MAG: DUF4230 domain-containing protein [Chloroflexota bacterium]
MSQQPPLPPELGTDYQAQASPLSEYVEIEVPVSNPTPVVSYQTNNNCLWGCGGMIGCGVLLIGLVAGTLYLGVNTVFSNFTSFFNLPTVTVNLGEPALPEIPDTVYVPDVERVQTLSQLTTTQYNYANVQSGAREIPQWLSILYGDSAVMVTVGTIEAGIDVSGLTQDAIIYDDLARTITITLPAPELQSCFLDESQSYVVSRDTGFFADPMDNLEDELRQRALIFHRDSALEDGILLDAETDARATLTDLLAILVNDETVTVNINFLPPDPNAPLPPSCQ